MASGEGEAELSRPEKWGPTQGPTETVLPSDFQLVSLRK